LSCVVFVSRCLFVIKAVAANDYLGTHTHGLDAPHTERHVFLLVYICLSHRVSESQSLCACVSVTS